MRTFYILDKKKVKEESITIPYLKRGFLYGDGIFETLRAKGSKIFMWHQHIRRLKKGAMVCGLEIPDDIDSMKEEIEKLLKKHRIKDAYIRINLWRKNPESFDPAGEKEAHILVMVRRYHPYPEKFYREGIRCIISKNYFRNEKSSLVYIKSLNYLENILARMEARREKCDDAILLNTSEYLACAAVSNLFFVKKERIYTPSLECGILKGTVRDMVFNICKRYGIKTEEGKFYPEELKDADEVFLTNTLMCLMPVKEIKGIFESKGFKISSFLREELEKL
ncbi:MAG: aminotransferase class IV [bacterium]|nr:aminotransferase class IV [bacterium]